MKAITLCAILALCASLRVFAQSEAGYRANIGMTAFNVADGVEVGRIVDVALMNGYWVYKVTRDGRIVNAPVDSVVPRKSASTAVKPPAPAPAPARGAPGSATPSAHPSAPAGEKVDPILLRTAAEFRTRLERYRGALQALLLTPKGISARWSSMQCDSFEPEIVDLLVSITRTQKASPAISGTRTCFTTVRAFAIKGATFHEYRTGRIGDAEVLATLR
jgi:hypothetical protein